MGRLFGTDGIRGLANQEPITTENGIKFGRSVVRFCKDRGLSTDIVIGRDTRISGEMLERAVASGITSAGGKALCVGVLPTPGIAFLTKDLNAGAGVVLSASHNPWEYNGFKLFSSEGYKLSDPEEAEIEAMILDQVDYPVGKDQVSPGLVEDALEKYVSFLLNSFSGPADIRKKKIVLDCANGATSQVAPLLFEKLGCNPEVMFAHPDGKNINLNCGSQHTGALSSRVVASKADIGLAFDGDGDRLIAVDEKGKTLTGDQILMICASMLKEKGELNNNVLVSTVMSNIGLKLALRDAEIDHVAAGVGDRLVMEEMKNLGSSIGGEESGHIIFLDLHTTGDGILAALQLLIALDRTGQKLSDLSNLMPVYPQTLLNLEVKSKPEIKDVSDLLAIIRDIECMLGEEGRVLVRYSGTEPVCRIMVEGKDQKEIEDYARRIGDVVLSQLG